MNRKFDGYWREMMILAEVIILIAMPYLGLIPDSDSKLENVFIVALTVALGGLIVTGIFTIIVGIISAATDEYCHSEKSQDKFLVVITVILVIIGAMLYT